jgi:hypothetical protein
MLKGNGWAIAKQRLLEKMSELSNILSIEELDPVKVMYLITANQQAIKLMIGWLQELDNSVSWAEDFKESLKNDMNKMVITSQEE